MDEVTPAFAAVVSALVSACKIVQAFSEKAEVRAFAQEVADFGRKLRGSIDAIDAPGHTPYFKQLGQNDFSARLNSLVVRHCGRVLYQQDRQRRAALVALHHLAKQSRWSHELVAEIAPLRDNVHLLNRVLREGVCPQLKDELWNVLVNMRDDDSSEGQRLLGIAAKIAPHAPSARGRPLSYESALHQALLYFSLNAGGREGYTYGLVRDGDEAVEDFTDEATAATRTELNLKSFNPISARRAAKKLIASDPAMTTGTAST